MLNINYYKLTQTDEPDMRGGHLVQHRLRALLLYRCHAAELITGDVTCNSVMSMKWALISRAHKTHFQVLLVAYATASGRSL